MTIKVKRTGRIVEHAQWFGFNHWIRAWVPGDAQDATAGFLHWHASEVEILKRP